LFEVPHGTVAADKAGGQILVHCREGRELLRWKVRLRPDGVVPRYEGIDEQGKPKDSPLSRTLLNWSSFFDELLDEAQRHDERNERLEWQAVRDYLERLKKEAQHPFRSVVVDIAEKMRRPLQETVRSSRRVLFRERGLLPACQMEETDSACLQWYIKQPGQSMAEKAGPRQRLLMVARKETHNLHENRILKDFLLRCSVAGKRYIANARSENQTFMVSKRIITVQALVALCNQLSEVPHLVDIPAPNPATPPNYVLLNDVRYRVIWYWYQKLLRQENEKDSFWDWQSRTWDDIARLLVSIAIILCKNQLLDNSSFRFSTVYEGALRIRSEQILGCRAAAGSETGPLLIERFKNGRLVHRAVMEIVHPDQAEHHPVTCHLGATGTHLYIVMRQLGTTDRAHVLIVWAAHTAGSSKSHNWDAIGKSAHNALQGYQALLNIARVSCRPHLSGLVICSNRERDKSEIEFDNKSGTVVISVPTAPANWLGAAEDIAHALVYISENINE